jgi:NhaA family Na+:H+ antiporter
MKIKRAPLREFLERESSSGALILISAALGLLVANSPISDRYFDLLGIEVHLGSGELALHFTVLKIINYALMTIFFFVVGLEIKRELTSGHLSSVRKAMAPFVAALGGMALPALIYLAIAGAEFSEGWGVPVATDIALAVGLLAMIGSSAPESLRSFLLGLAVIDDIGAILIIAFVYSTGVNFMWMTSSAVVVLLVVAARKFGVTSTIVYVLLGVALWYFLYKTGVHPTLAGVILGLLTPNILKVTKKNVDPDATPLSVIEWLEFKLHPVSAFLVVPLFAFANTGVVINSDSLSQATKSVIAWGIFFGLVVGKPLGIVMAAVTATKLKVAEFPAGASKPLVTATGSAAGIGFTVAIFIAHLAFTDPVNQEIAIIAVIAASLVSAVISMGLFRIFAPKK